MASYYATGETSFDRLRDCERLIGDRKILSVRYLHWNDNTIIEVEDTKEHPPLEVRGYMLPLYRHSFFVQARGLNARSRAALAMLVE